MKRRRLSGGLIAICLFLYGCGADCQNLDASQTKYHTEVREEQTADNAADENGTEQTTLNFTDESGGQFAQRDGGSANAADLAAEEQHEKTAALVLQKGSPQLAKMVEEQAKVLEEYAAFLAEYEPQQENEQQPLRFALLFLDGNDVPELIVIEGTAHAQGASVYTFQKRHVISVGTYGQYGALGYREKEGILFDDYDTQGDIFSRVYQIKENQAVLLQSYDSIEPPYTGQEEELEYTYHVDGKEVTEEQYQKISEKWSADGYRMIQYDDCRALPESDIQRELQEELEDRILTREDVLKRNLLTAAGAQENQILLFDCDDYDGDGKYEAFMIVGKSHTYPGGWGEETTYTGTLYFAGAAHGVSALSDSYGIYRKIDGVMDFGSRKYLFFYTDQYATANISELWTVRDGKPVEESGLLQRGEVVYRNTYPREEFEIWVDAYDWEHDIDVELDIDMWIGHTWKPYFYHYDQFEDRLKAYGGEEIAKDAFAALSETGLIEEIEAKGYTVGEIICWANDIVTINYHNANVWEGIASSEYYENIIWDNRIKDYWRKEERGVTSWENAGEGGSYELTYFENQEKWRMQGTVNR